jgi:hypothetical protein
VLLCTPRSSCCLNPRCLRHQSIPQPSVDQAVAAKKKMRICLIHEPLHHRINRYFCPCQADPSSSWLSARAIPASLLPIPSSTFPWNLSTWNHPTSPHLTQRYGHCPTLTVKYLVTGLFLNTSRVLVHVVSLPITITLQSTLALDEQLSPVQ